MNKTSLQSGANPLVRPNPFAFHDPAVFLKELFCFLHHTEPDFSIRKLGRSTAISVGYLSNIIHGKRRLSTKGLKKILPGLPLSPAEGTYLIGLSRTMRARQIEVRAQGLQRLQRFHKYAELNPKEVVLFRYFSKWYVPAIRELSALPDFSLDPKWIQSRLRYSLDLPKIERAIDFLLDAGILVREPDGRVKVPEQKIEGVADVLRVALIQHHRAMFELAKLSLEKTPGSERQIVGHTFAMSSEQIDKAKAIVNRAVQDLEALTDECKTPDTIYHCSIALFPLTQKDESVGGKT